VARSVAIARKAGGQPESNNPPSSERRSQILSALVEGNSVFNISRMSGAGALSLAEPIGQPPANSFAASPKVVSVRYNSGRELSVDRGEISQPESVQNLTGGTFFLILAVTFYS
jgi:hypothetical protein